MEAPLQLLDQPRKRTLIGNLLKGICDCALIAALGVAMLIAILVAMIIALAYYVWDLVRKGIKTQERAENLNYKKCEQTRQIYRANLLRSMLDPEDCNITAIFWQPNTDEVRPFSPDACDSSETFTAREFLEALLRKNGISTERMIYDFEPAIFGVDIDAISPDYAAQLEELAGKLIYFIQPGNNGWRVVDFDRKTGQSRQALIPYAS